MAKPLKHVFVHHVINFSSITFWYFSTCEIFTRAVASGGALAPPVFGQTVNPISTKGSDYAHHSNPSPPPDFQTLRRPCIRRADASSAIVDLKTHSYESVTIAMSHSLPSVVGLDGAELIWYRLLFIWRYYFFDALSLWNKNLKIATILFWKENDTYFL